MGYPNTVAGWFMMENRIKQWMRTGVTFMEETSI